MVAQATVARRLQLTPSVSQKVMRLDDPRWAGLCGGYRVPYDPRQALGKLRDNRAVDEAWSELWQELHHQGDVGEASYATVPVLAQIHSDRGVPDWNTYALAVTIELCRKVGQNPDVPDWLRGDYDAAWAKLLGLAIADIPRAGDETTLRSVLSAIAVARGEKVVGRVLIDFSADELDDMVRQYLDPNGSG